MQPGQAPWNNRSAFGAGFSHNSGIQMNTNFGAQNHHVPSNSVQQPPASLGGCSAQGYGSPCHQGGVPPSFDNSGSTYNTHHPQYSAPFPFDSDSSGAMDSEASFGSVSLHAPPLSAMQHHFPPQCTAGLLAASDSGLGTMLQAPFLDTGFFGDDITIIETNERTAIAHSPASSSSSLSSSSSSSSRASFSSSGDRESPKAVRASGKEKTSKDAKKGKKGELSSASKSYGSGKSSRSSGCVSRKEPKKRNPVPDEVPEHAELDKLPPRITAEIYARLAANNRQADQTEGSWANDCTKDYVLDHMFFEDKDKDTNSRIEHHLKDKGFALATIQWVRHARYTFRNTKNKAEERERKAKDPTKQKKTSSLPAIGKIARSIFKKKK